MTGTGDAAVSPGSTALPDAARIELGRWRAECLARPGNLPVGVVPVQTRLVRSVGRGELPGIGPCYVKVMGFPRARDRLRYSVRELPAAHEARMLRRAGEVGIPCPEVLDLLVTRRGALPYLSMLVTRGLPTLSACESPETETETETVVCVAQMAELAARLARIGLFHPDLNPGNFVRTSETELAVIDLQSARLCRAPLSRRLRRRMAAKLLAECGNRDVGAALVRAGLCGDADLDRVLAQAVRMRRTEVVRRIRRCLIESSEFQVERRWNGRVVRLRCAVGDGTRVRGGRELLAMWIGQRALQVLDGRPPILCALFKKSWWLPGDHSVYIRSASTQEFRASHAPELLDGFRRWRELSGGIGFSSGRRARPPARTGSDLE